jgi:hypothetical protein
MRGMTTFSLINMHAFLHLSITRRPTTHVRWIFTDSILSRWHASRRRSIKVVDATPTNSAVHYPKYQNRTTYLRRPNSIAGTVPLRAMCLLIDLNTTADPKSSRCYLRRADRIESTAPAQHTESHCTGATNPLRATSASFIGSNTSYHREYLTLHRIRILVVHVESL